MQNTSTRSLKNNHKENYWVASIYASTLKYFFIKFTSNLDQPLCELSILFSFFLLIFRNSSYILDSCPLFYKDLPLWGLPFHFLYYVCWWTRFLNYTVDGFINAFLYSLLFFYYVFKKSVLPIRFILSSKV